MADRLLIVLVNTDPTNPISVGAPFFQATVAAAMGYRVEVILSGRASALAKQGMAEAIRVHEDAPKTVYDFIKDAAEAGVKFKICTATVEMWGQEDLIPEIEETVGGAYIITEAMTDGTVTFTY